MLELITSLIPLDWLLAVVVAVLGAFGLRWQSKRQGRKEERNRRRLQALEEARKRTKEGRDAMEDARSSDAADWLRRRHDKRDS